MLLMLAYDVPEQKHQTLLRKEFERLGGQRVQYSIYLFSGESHEVEKVIRYMRRLLSVLMAIYGCCHLRKRLGMRKSSFPK